MKQIYANRLLQEFVRYTLDKPIAYVWFKPGLDGKEHIPKKGPAIFAFNHVSIPDSFAIGSRIGVNYFHTKVEPFVSVIKPIAMALGMYPVDTHKTAEHREIAYNYGRLFPRRRHEKIIRELNKYLIEDERLENLDTLDNRLWTEYALRVGARALIHVPGGRKTYDRIENPKNGAAWNAFNMLDKYGVVVPIIPGAIVYSLHRQPIIIRDLKWPITTKSRISVGEQITVEDRLDHFRRDRHEAVAELTDLIVDAIDEQTNLIISNLQEHRKN